MKRAAAFLALSTLAVLSMALTPHGTVVTMPYLPVVTGPNLLASAIASTVGLWLMIYWPRRRVPGARAVRLAPPPRPPLQ